jgi:hypothetical protein
MTSIRKIKYGITWCGEDLGTKSGCYNCLEFYFLVKIRMLQKLKLGAVKTWAQNQKPTTDRRSWE